MNQKRIDSLVDRARNLTLLARTDRDIGALEIIRSSLVDIKAEMAFGTSIDPDVMLKIEAGLNRLENRDFTE